MPAVPVTLAVDPALVEELRIMAAGPYAVAGDAVGGAAKADAIEIVSGAHAFLLVGQTLLYPVRRIASFMQQRAGRPPQVMY